MDDLWTQRSKKEVWLPQLDLFKFAVAMRQREFAGNIMVARLLAAGFQKEEPPGLSPAMAQLHSLFCLKLSRRFVSGYSWFCRQCGLPVREEELLAPCGGFVTIKLICRFGCGCHWQLPVLPKFSYADQYKKLELIH